MPYLSTLILTWHSDPGHEWLEVPIELIRKLNVSDKISGYSYVSRDLSTAYLEGDCDAAVVLDAVGEAGLEFKVTFALPTDGDSPIRSLPRFVSIPRYK